MSVEKRNKRKLFWQCVGKISVCYIITIGVTKEKVSTCFLYLSAAFGGDKSWERVWNANPSSGIWTTFIRSSSECVSVVFCVWLDNWVLVFWSKLPLQTDSFPYTSWQMQRSHLLYPVPEFLIIHIRNLEWSSNGRTVLKLHMLRDRILQCSHFPHAAAPKLLPR